MKSGLAKVIGILLVVIFGIMLIFIPEFIFKIFFDQELLQGDIVIMRLVGFVIIGITAFTLLFSGRARYEG